MKLNIIVLLLTLIVTAYCKPAAYAQENIRFGIILPLTGDAANIGKACQRGVQMSYEKLDPDIQKRIKLVFEDDVGNSTKTVSAYRKLTSERVEVLLSFTSGASKAIAPLAETAKIPLIAIASDPEIIQNKKFVMNLWVAPREQVNKLQVLLAQRGLYKIARITAVQSGMLAIKQAFDTIGNDKFKMIIDEEYSPETKDFKAYITKISQRKDLDAIVVLLYLGQTGIFAKQVREMGVQLPLVNIETFEDPTEVQLSQGALIGQEYVQADDPVGEFSKEFKQRFPLESSVTAGNCYDAVSLVAEAIRSGKNINDYLHSVKDFSGAMGNYSAKSDNTFSLPAVIKKVTKDGFERVP